MRPPAHAPHEKPNAGAKPLPKRLGTERFKGRRFKSSSTARETRPAAAALQGEITIDQGTVEEGNFPQYERVRLATAPDIVILRGIDLAGSVIRDLEDFEFKIQEESRSEAAATFLWQAEPVSGESFE